jgi:FSR family fosmidomycin resistance protein-like MFS transporter
MSSLTVADETRSAPAPISGALRLRLAAPILSHAAVDYFSFTIVPLMTVIKGRLDLSGQQGAAVIAVGSVCSGIIQPLVAWLTDRWDTRVLGTLGFLIAVLAMGSIGYVESYGALMLLQVLGAIGIGAFHPVAAAAVGHLSGRRRSLGISWFYLAGMLGCMGGNIVTPLWVIHFGAGSSVRGMQTLAWLIAPGIACVAMLAWAVHSIPHRSDGAAAAHAALHAGDRRARWAGIGLLYAGNVLRFIVDIAVITLVIRWSETITLAGAGAAEFTESLRSQASTLNGPLQAAKQAGMGLAGLAAGWLLRSHHERLALIFVPLLGAAAIAAMPHVSGTTAALAITALAGVGYGGMIPVTISLAQRLLPHRTGLASGLMMGGAWSIASIGAPIAQSLADTFGLPTAFAAIAAACALSGLLALGLSSRMLRAVNS